MAPAGRPAGTQTGICPWETLALCITQCITSTQCTTKKKPRLRNLAKPGLLSERRTKVRTGDPELGKLMRGALVPATWRICWVQDAHYAHERALRAGDLHQERISGGLPLRT